MPVQELKYCEYFDVDETYFPCIDESAINSKSGVPWDNTYPHQTFVDLLNQTEKMLGGNTGRSIWIHGAYGTGKSRCAYTLKKLLEVPESEVRAYWDKFKPLKKNPVLLEKLKVHYALMPVWMLNTKWNGKDFLFAMNGQTGRLVGELPVSRGRFWALFAAIAVPLSVLSSVLFTLL